MLLVVINFKKFKYQKFIFKLIYIHNFAFTLFHAYTPKFMIDVIAF